MEEHKRTRISDYCENCYTDVINGLMFHVDGYGYVCVTCQAEIAKEKYKLAIDNSK